MAYLEIQNLNFSYPGKTQNALEDFSLSVEAGEFCMILGESGSGKSTLLSLLTPSLCPVGKKSGQIRLAGNPLTDPTQGVALVRQDAEIALVTDKVWHELAFQPENLGMPQETMRLRVGEVAAAFGLEELFYRDTDSLSGGQKQLLSIASLLTSTPSLLLLDEPTSSLDPVTTLELASLLRRINQEYGTTIILCEQRPEPFFPLADRVVVMKEGKQTEAGTPREILPRLKESGFSDWLPAEAQLGLALPSNNPVPLTIKEGRKLLVENTNLFIPQTDSSETEPPLGKPVLAMKEGYFRYEKDGKDILRGMNLDLVSGEILFLLGVSGGGKSTALNALAGKIPLLRGKISKEKGLRMAMLPQDARMLFSEESIQKDLERYGDNESREKIIQALSLMPLLNQNILDVSGGERQRAAFALTLLKEPDLLLLDEPTKGMDPKGKRALLRLIQEEKAKGVSVICVSHDLEFAAKCADRCGLIFDGQVLSLSPARVFFHSAHYFSPAAVRLTRGIAPCALTTEELMARLEVTR